MMGEGLSGGEGERWFIKDLEGWRADGPLHRSPHTVQEIECRSARAPQYTAVASLCAFRCAEIRRSE